VRKESRRASLHTQWFSLLDDDNQTSGRSVGGFLFLGSYWALSDTKASVLLGLLGNNRWIDGKRIDIHANRGE
jgi:hypothetical protein